MSINMRRNYARLLLHFRRHDLDEFLCEHDRLFAEAKSDGDHTRVTAHYYSIMSRVIDDYFNGNFHFAPPLEKNQTLQEALRSLHLRIVNELRVKPTDRCLDVGCGIGTVIGELAFTGADFTGVTIAANEVEIGNANFVKSEIADRCRLVEADCAKLPFEAASFDSAYAIYSLKYLADVAPALAEIARVLKPRGRFVVYDLHKTDAYDAQRPKHTKVLSAIEYACGMPPLHARGDVIETARSLGLTLTSAVDLADETKRAFHYGFSSSPLFMWLVRSRLVGRLIKAGQTIRLLPTGFYAFNKIFLSGTVANIVKAGELGILSGAEMLVFEKNS